MELTEDEFNQKEYDERKSYLQDRYEGWTVEDHLQAMIAPGKAISQTYREWTPPELEYELETEYAEHYDALKMLHEYKGDINEAVNTAYSELSSEKQMEANKEASSLLNWHPGRYWQNYQEIEPDIDDR